MTASEQSLIRRTALAKRRALNDQQRQRANAAIQQKFLRSGMFYRCQTIACYLAMHDEVQTERIFSRAWQAGKSIYVPVTSHHRQMRFVKISRNSRLQRGAFGIWQPLDGEEIHPRKLDVVVTPLVAFDAARHRIGMGGGYYDTAFSFLKTQRKWLRTKLIGLAFACQKTQKIVANPWDIALSGIITESADT